LLSLPQSWTSTLAFAIGGLIVLLAYTPLADMIASYWIETPPTLGAFRGLQQSRAKLILGIVIAWILGGFIEEIALRGIIVRMAEAFLAARMPGLRQSRLLFARRPPWRSRPIFIRASAPRSS